jgi:hypothetical protein
MKTPFTEGSSIGPSVISTLSCPVASGIASFLQAVNRNKRAAAAKATENTGFNFEIVIADCVWLKNVCLKAVGLKALTDGYQYPPRKTIAFEK